MDTQVREAVTRRLPCNSKRENKRIQILSLVSHLIILRALISSGVEWLSITKEQIIYQSMNIH